MKTSNQKGSKAEIYRICFNRKIESRCAESVCVEHTLSRIRNREPGGPAYSACFLILVSCAVPGMFECEIRHRPTKQTPISRKNKTIYMLRVLVYSSSPSVVPVGLCRLPLL